MVVVTSRRSSLCGTSIPRWNRVCIVLSNGMRVSPGLFGHDVPNLAHLVPVGSLVGVWRLQRTTKVLLAHVYLWSVLYSASIEPVLRDSITTTSFGSQECSGRRVHEQRN